MAPHETDPLSTSLQAMTQDEILSLRLHLKITNHHINHSKPRFKCSICGKALSSYHALGGHKSSHRRPLDPNQIKPPKINVKNMDLIATSEGLPHRCNVCYKSFSTGQALGGHKRCHYLDEFSAFDSANCSANSTLSSVRDFDLNLPPKNEFLMMNGWGEEEEEEVSSPLPAKKQPWLI